MVYPKLILKIFLVVSLFLYITGCTVNVPDRTKQYKAEGRYSELLQNKKNELGLGLAANVVSITPKQVRQYVSYADLLVKNGFYEKAGEVYGELVKVCDGISNAKLRFKDCKQMYFQYYLSPEIFGLDGKDAYRKLKKVVLSDSESRLISVPVKLMAMFVTKAVKEGDVEIAKSSSKIYVSKLYDYESWNNEKYFVETNMASAWMEYAQGNNEESLSQFRRIFNVVSSEGIGNVRDFVIPYGELVRGRSSSEDVARLIRKGQSDLLRRGGSFNLDNVDSYIVLANLCERINDYRCVESEYRSAIELIEELRLRAGPDKLSYRRRVFAKLADIYFEYSRVLVKQNKLEEAFSVAENAKSRTLLDEALSLEYERKFITDEKDYLVLKGARQKIAEEEVRYVSSGTPVDKNIYSEYKRYKNKIYTKYPLLKQTIPAVVYSNEIKNTLGDEGVFLSYLISSDGRLLSFAVTNSSVTANYLKTPLDSKQIEFVRASLFGTGIKNKSKKYLELVSMSLFSAHKELKSKKNWVVSPDGILSSFPFGIATMHGQPVAKHHTISYSQSASAYVLSRQRMVELKATDKPKELLSFGGAEYIAPIKLCSTRGISMEDKRSSFNQDSHNGGAYSSPWCPLPATYRESVRLGRLYGGASDIYVGENATKSKFKQLNSSGKLTNYKVVHLATHGYLDPVNPESSAVVFGAEGNKPRKEGVITAKEWAVFDIRAELVVLSACETGLGSFIQGDGVSGLPYSFFLSGSGATILTLWQIDDAATEEFMVNFFTRVKSGSDYAYALAETKKWFMTQAKNPAWKDPFYWAPFVIYGG